jgi:O-glycosyl hydrolase
MIVLLLVLVCTLQLSSFVTSSNVRSWLTSADPVTAAAIKLLEEQSPIFNSKTGSSFLSINIDVEQKKQTILGYGAGLPQSSAYVLNSLKSRDVGLYNTVLNKLFGTSNDGAAINILRFPIGSCDFSMTNTSYDEIQDDYSLDSFAIDSDSQLIVSVLTDILAVNPNMVLIGERSLFSFAFVCHKHISLIRKYYNITIATPWSAPSWLKSWDTLIAYSEQNTLLQTSDAYAAYSRYFAKVLQSFLNEGITINYFTLQNEPLFGTSDQYPGMYFSAEQAAKLGKIACFLTQLCARSKRYKMRT